MQLPRRRWLDLLCLFIAAHFTIAYLTLTTVMVPLIPFTPEFARGGPFAFRMLPAMLWSVALWCAQPFAQHPWPALNPPFQSPQECFIALVTFLSIAGAMLTIRRTIRFSCPAWAEWFAPLLGILAYFDLILPLHRNIWYPYDALAIFFFALLIDAAYRNRPWLFVLALPFAILNKETAIMTVIAYAAFQYTHMQTRRLAILCGSFATVALVIREIQKAWILHVCHNMCGTGTQHLLLFNLKQLLNPLFWLALAGVFGFAWVLLVLLWDDIPPRIRRAVVWVGAAWIAAMLWNGILRELRIFSELSVLVVLSIATGAAHYLANMRHKKDAPGI
jgi:hypothetical protein